MKHTVKILNENGNTIAMYQDCSKKEAITYAKKEGNSSNNVFISADNGQCTVYLNPDGNYEPVGKSW
jgi:hypothetical protein